MRDWEYYLEPGTPDINACYIDQDGYARMANIDLAIPEYERLKAIFPDLCMIDGAGVYGQGQIFYLPAHRDRFVKELEKCIRDGEERLLRWKNALRKERRRKI